MKKKKIWIISEVFYPEETSTGYIMTCITEALAEDHEVHVICGPIGYEQIRKTDAGEDFKFAIHRIRIANFNKNNLIGRLIRLVILSFGMFLKGLISIKRDDLVLVVTNPAFSIPLFSILKSIKGFSYVILVHDVFPENLIPANIIQSKSNIFYLVLEHCFNWSYQKATHLIVLGRDMENVMKDKTKFRVKTSIIENWADLENIYPATFHTNPVILNASLQDKIVFLFAGNVGRLQGLNFLIEIANELKNDVVHFAIAGDGALLAELKRKVVENKMNNFTFLGSYTRSEQNIFLNACHFGIVTLEDDLYGLGVPSKTYNIMAAGKPIFYIGNKKSEVGLMLAEHNCGISFDKNDKQLIIDFLNGVSKSESLKWSEMGTAARVLAEAKYAKESILVKFRELLLNKIL